MDLKGICKGMHVYMRYTKLAGFHGVSCDCRSAAAASGLTEDIL